MERIKNTWSNLSLRRSFIVTVLLLEVIVLLLSTLTVSLCLWGRNYLLPDAQRAYLTLEKEYSDGSVVQETMSISLEDGSWESPVAFVSGTGDDGGEPAGEVVSSYHITKAEDAFQYLTPKRKLAYRALGFGMVFMPALYVIVGILLAAVWFYRHKLSLPIQEMEYAIEQIKQQNLDFAIEPVSGDELGQVCSSLEVMRQALCQNNQSMWNMIEERKQLQKSVAHDLRNPITIIQTYAEYLKLNLRTGRLEEESLEGMVDNLQLAAKRLEQYTDSIRDISHLEELEVHPEVVSLEAVLPEMLEELGLLAEKEGKRFIYDMRQGQDQQEQKRGQQQQGQDRQRTRDQRKSRKEATVCTDVSALYRILENLVTNASRYAGKEVCISCASEPGYIRITVSDDGPGFSQKVLSGQSTYFFTTDAEDGHMGMGLSICRILCRKLGGRMKLYNRQGGGAGVTIWLLLTD